MINERIVVTVTNYSDTTLNSDGERSVMLHCVAGKMPNRGILAGTVAKNAGFEVGKTYLATVRETGMDTTYGRQFSFLRIAELKGSEIIEVCNQIGKAEMITIEKLENPASVPVRRSEARQSKRQLQIAAGTFIPVKTGVSHERQGVPVPNSELVISAE